MNKGTKIALGVVAGLVGLSLILCGVGFLVVRNMANSLEFAGPEEAAEVAQSILDYDLPPGYAEMVAFDMFGSSMVTIGSQSEPLAPQIMIMTFPSFQDQDTMLSQFEQAAESQQSGGFNMEVVESGEIVVNGNPAFKQVLEGRGQGGEAFRQVQIIFEGKTNPGILMIQGSVAYWDAAAMDRFIRSLE